MIVSNPNLVEGKIVIDHASTPLLRSSLNHVMPNRDNLIHCILLFCLIVFSFLGEGCRSAYDNPSTPCGNPRYGYLRDNQTALTEVERVELDSFNKACDRYLRSNPEQSYSIIGIVMAIAVAVALVLTVGAV